MNASHHCNLSRRSWVLCILLITACGFLAVLRSVADGDSRKYDHIYVKVISGSDFSEIIKLRMLDLKTLPHELLAEIFQLAEDEEERMGDEDVKSYIPNLDAAFIATLTCRNAQSKDHIAAILRFSKDGKIIGTGNVVSATTPKLERYLFKLIDCELKKIGHAENEQRQEGPQKDGQKE